MYEDDTPMAERRRRLSRSIVTFCAELLGTEELRELLDGDVVDEIEEELRGDADTVDHLHDLLLRRGDQGREAIDASLADALVAQRRAIWIKLAGTDRLIAIEDAGRYRDALGVVPLAVFRRPTSTVASHRCASCSAATPRTRTVHDRRCNTSVRWRPRATRARTGRARGGRDASCAESSAPGGASMEWCDPTSFVGCAAQRSRGCGRRSSRSSPPPGAVPAPLAGNWRTFRAS